MHPATATRAGWGAVGIDSHDPDWVTGRFGNALRFDGESNDFVTVRDPAGLRPNRITVEAWVRRLGGPGSWRYVVSSGASACDSAPYGYSGFSGGLAFYVSDQQRYVVSPRPHPPLSGTATGTMRPGPTMASGSASTWTESRSRRNRRGPASTTVRRPAASSSAPTAAPVNCPSPGISTRSPSTIVRSPRGRSPGKQARAQQPLPVQLPPVTGPPSSPRAPTLPEAAHE